MEWLIGKRRFPNALIHLAYPLSVKVRAGLPWAILLAGGHPLGCSARLDARQQANSPHAAGLDDRSLGRAMPSFRSVCAERWSDHQFTPPGRSPDDGDTARSGLRRRSLQTCCPLGRASSVWVDWLNASQFWRDCRRARTAGSSSCLGADFLAMPPASGWGAAHPANPCLTP